MSQTLISVIIVNYNTRELLRDCLRSVFSFSGNFEVIVVDNASSDGSVAMLEAEFAGQVRLVKNDNNLGFGAANNIGAKQANGELLFFLNSDTLMKENIWMGLAMIFSDVSVAVASPMILMSNGSEQPYSYGVFPSVLNLIFSRQWHQLGNESAMAEVDWVTGAAMLVRREVFEKMRGFDENFFMYFEDMDLCLRAKSFGKVVSLRTASITHLGGASIADNSSRKDLYYVSQDYYFLKHYGKIKVVLLRLLRWVYKKIR